MWKKRVLAGQEKTVRKTFPARFGQSANESCVPLQNDKTGECKIDGKKQASRGLSTAFTGRVWCAAVMVSDTR